MINDTLFDVANVLIRNKNKFPELNDALKEKYFFIINRYLSKRLPFAIDLNHKKIDKVLAFDLWYYYLLDKPYPAWMWSKSEKAEVEKSLSNKERELLIKFYDITDTDLDFLIQWEPKQIKEDLKYLIQIEKQK